MQEMPPLEGRGKAPSRSLAVVRLTALASRARVAAELFSGKAAFAQSKRISRVRGRSTQLVEFG